jgi:hypothetical protein
MGTWSFTYDAVDRLMTATPGGSNPTEYQGKYGCWTYNRGPRRQVFVAGVENRGPRRRVLVAGVEDSFGNRTLEAFSGVTCTGTNPTPQAYVTKDDTFRVYLLVLGVGLT